MADPKKQISPDEELDNLLAESTQDKLPMAAVPPAPDFAADAELDSLLKDDDSTNYAQKREQEPAEFVDNPVANSGAPKPVEKQPELPWFKRLLGLHNTENQQDPAEWNRAVQHMTQMSTPGGVAKKFAANTAAMMAGGATGEISGAGAGALAGATAEAADNPNATGTSVGEHAMVGGVLGAAAPVVSGALSNLATRAKNFGNELLTHTFMTPAQRAGFKAVKGNDALAELGQKAEDAGLFKPRGVLDYLLPRNARRVAENAETVQNTAGPAIGRFEDQYVNSNSTAEVPVGDIAKNLRSKAAATRTLIDPSAPSDAQSMEALANRIDQPTTAEVTGEATQFPQLFTPKGPQPRPPLPPKPEPEQMSMIATPGPAPVMPQPANEQQSLNFYSEPEQTAMNLQPEAQTSLGFPATQTPAKIAPPRQLDFVKNQPFDSAAWKGPQTPAAPPAPQAEQLDFGPSQMSLPGVPARPAPKPEPWRPSPAPQGEQLDLGMNEVQKTPLAGQATLTRDSMPLPEAVANKRDLGNRIDWAMKRSDQTTIGQEAARKYTWGELRDRITNALQEEVAAGKIPASALADYQKNMQDFSTAATVYDPALKMAEKNGQSGLSLTDLAAGAALGGGPAGGLAVLAHKASRGMAPATAARVSKIVSGAMSLPGAAMQEAGNLPAAVGGKLTPVEQAQQENPGATKQAILEDANSKLKQQWYDIFLPKDKSGNTNFGVPGI